MTHSLRAMLSATLEDVVTSPLDETQDTTMSDDIIVAEERAEAETELRMTEEAIDVLEETEESLEEITAKMEELVENDEVTEEAVMFLNMALNMTMRNAGVDSVIAGTESFGDHKVALKAGLEAAEESKQGVIAAIKKFVAEMWEKLVAWFKSIFTAVGRLKKGAEALAKSDLKGAPIEKEVEIGKKAAKLMIGGKVVDNIGNEVMKLAAFTGKIGDTKAYINSVKEMANAVLDEIESPSGFKVEKGYKYRTASPSETIKDKIDDLIDNVGLHFGVKHGKEVGEEILGQVHFVYEDSNSGLLNVSPVRLVPVPKAKSGGDVMLKALDAKDIKVMAGAIHKLAEAMEKMDKGSEVMKKFSKDYSVKYDEVVKSLKAEGVNLQTRAKTYVTMRLIRAMVKDTHKPIAALTSHTFSVLSAAYAYALASKKNLKGA